MEIVNIFNVVSLFVFATDEYRRETKENDEMLSL